MTDKQSALVQMEWWWALVWPVLSAVINAAFRVRTPEEWADICETSPRFAGFVRFFRATGLDVHKAFEALQQLTAGGK